MSSPEEDFSASALEDFLVSSISTRSADHQLDVEKGQVPPEYAVGGDETLELLGSNFGAPNSPIATQPPLPRRNRREGLVPIPVFIHRF